MGTSYLAGNAVTAAKIRDGEVKAADIATDAVGAAELQGVTRLLFASCPYSSSSNISPRFLANFECNVPGATNAENVIAMRMVGNSCFEIAQAFIPTSPPATVDVSMVNDCPSSSVVGTGTVSIIVFHK